MSIVLKEGRQAGAYIVSEDINISREQVVIAAGCVVEAGTILGKRASDGKYVPLNPQSDDGSAQFSGICFDNVDASEEDKVATITARLAAVKKDLLIWPEGMTEQNMASVNFDLALSTIVLR